MLICGALPPEVYNALRCIMVFSDSDLRLTTSWQDPPPWGATSTVAPPGQGKFLIKVGDRPGIPFHVTLTRLLSDWLRAGNSPHLLVVGSRVREASTRTAHADGDVWTLRVSAVLPTSRRWVFEAFGHDLETDDLAARSGPSARRLSTGSTPWRHQTTSPSLD
jgi:hypothetical protein